MIIGAHGESIEAILPRRCLLTSSALDGRAWATKIPWIHQKKSKGEQSKKIHCLRDWNIMQMVEKNGNRPKVGTRKVVYVVSRYVCYHMDGKIWNFLDLIMPWIHQKKSKGEQSEKIHCLCDWNIMQMVKKW